MEREYSNEEKKHWLREYENITIKLSSLYDQKMEIAANMASVKAMNYDGMPKATGNRADLADIIIKYENLCKAIDNKIIEQQKIRYKITKAIFNLKNGKESQVIQKKYIDLMTWEKVAESLGYDLRYVYRIHGNALSHLEIEN